MKMVSLRLSFPNNEIHGKEGMGGFRVRRKGGGFKLPNISFFSFSLFQKGGGRVRDTIFFLSATFFNLMASLKLVD